MKALGINLSEGLIGGVDEQKEPLKSGFFGWVDSIIGWVKGFFGINSPSKEFKTMLMELSRKTGGTGCTERPYSVYKEAIRWY